MIETVELQDDDEPDSFHKESESEAKTPTSPTLMISDHEVSDSHCSKR